MAKLKLEASFKVVVSFIHSKPTPRIWCPWGFLLIFLTVNNKFLTIYVMIYRDFFFVFYLHLIIEIRRSDNLEA